MPSATNSRIRASGTRAGRQASNGVAREWRAPGKRRTSRCAACLGPALVFNLAGELEVNRKSWQVSQPASFIHPTGTHVPTQTFSCISPATLLLAPQVDVPNPSGLETRIVELVRYEMTVSGPKGVVASVFHPDPRWVPGTIHLRDELLVVDGPLSTVGEHRREQMRHCQNRTPPWSEHQM